MKQLNRRALPGGSSMTNLQRWVLPLFLVLASAASFAQSTNSVVNVDTGVSKTFTTNQDGLYDTSSIVIGSYKLTFSREGFEELVRGPVSLQVGFTTVNAQLVVGSTKQTVTVSADVTLLKTETSEQSTTMEAKSMDQLPQVAGAAGVSWENFMILLPGATGTPG